MDRRRLSYLRQMGLDCYIPRDAVVTEVEPPSSGGAQGSGAAPSWDVDGDQAGPASLEAGAAGREAPVRAPGVGQGEQPPAAPGPEGGGAADASEGAQPAALDGPEPGGGCAAAVDVSTLGWDALEAQVAACYACRLNEGRTHTVFGVGDRAADLVIVGEGPGAEEDRQGEPFVGPAGRLLDAMLAAIHRGRQRGGVYICNTIKCRAPGNRDPRPDEVAACSPYLRRQLELLEPRAIAALGRVAAQRLLQTSKPLSRLRGQAHTYPGTEIPVWVTYHPAYLLRSPGEKAKAWQDLKRIRQLVEAA